ncbi:ArgS-related anticodon-binding protein NrtL [Streptomyces sp. NBC_00566]|uniref:ArgS-related anticodon-binding protein NrtL n=1 Tax=Streptomyces sp. NBC_00566 TaxID=2975778 RepID=UPI002E81EFF0|nr:DALR anticodon-binding domain-containing protein [Streptomyces sp. NBC_00566]WUB86809.1 DALR anticodon-binding domain-containing protein [Streptomyces sp. NBC_00566]
MTPAELSRTVLDAVRRAVDAGELGVDLPERVTVTEPGPGGCGDFATNVALRLARPAGLPPLRVAEILRARLLDAEGVDDVVVTGPGFLNITLRARDELLTGLVREIRELGTEYGHGDALAGRTVVLRVPYEVRAEVVADSVARLVATQGGRAEIEHGEPVNLRPVPAPEDPAPLGPDAARWALLHPAPHDRPRVTADHLVQREINPLFRVRYAHARVRALTRNAHDLGFAAEPGELGSAGTADVGGPRAGTHAGSTSHPLQTPLTDHSRILATAATDHAPDRLARHLLTVADALLPLLPEVLPVGEEKPTAAHRARLALAEAAGAVLAGGLSLLGIDAPEHL